MTDTPDQMCTCGHCAASAHDIHVSIPAFTACVVTGCTCKAFTQAPDAEHQHVPGEDYCRCGKILPCDDAKPAPMDPVHILGIGAEPAPRQARRDTIRYILDRLDRGLTLTENERFALRNRINAEQIDGDQAREQRDQASASLTDLRNDLYAERRAHEEHRRSLAVLHGLHPDADWLNVTAAVTSVLSARDRDRRFLTEARRLRDEACGLLDSQQLAVSEALGLGTSAPWDAIVERASALAADPLLRMLDSPVVGVAALGAAAHEHAARMVRKANERAEQAQQTAREARRGESEAVRAREAAEAERDASSRFAEASGTRAYRANERAERAEATVREIAPILNDLTDPDPCQHDHHGYCQAHAWLAVEPPCPHARAKAFTAALDGGQSDTKPERCCVCGSPEVAPRGYGTQRYCWPCALNPVQPADPCTHGCRDAANDVTRLGEEMDAETVCVHLVGGECPCPPTCGCCKATPTKASAEPELIPILDYAVRRLATAIRNALSGQP